VAARKKREFRQWEYWGKPVPGFGDPQARLWIVGLAPAAHGANRTGRVYTGDKSREWLYGALHRFGCSNREISQSRDDGLRLEDAYISSAARCAPPGNKPLPQEIGNSQCLRVSCSQSFPKEVRSVTARTGGDGLPFQTAVAFQILWGITRAFQRIPTTSLPNRRPDEHLAHSPVTSSRTVTGGTSRYSIRRRPVSCCDQ
jgi:hypothetical protein